MSTDLPNPRQSPRSHAVTPSMSFAWLVDTVEMAQGRRSPEEIAGVQWVADAIGQYVPRIGALGEAAALADRQYRAALAEWIRQDWTCKCVEHCDQDPKTRCSLSGERHVHPAIRNRPGAYGPCPRHPDAPGDL